jgi:RNA polymerase sigma-70 factor (ECF subfamily)
MTDAELVRRVLAGDQAAYADIVRAHQAKILRLCASLLRDTSLAEDAAQDVFLKAYQALRQFRGRSSFGTWLYRIAANHCLDLLRQRRREAADSWDALVESGAAEPEPSGGAVRDPRAVAADTDVVRRALASLPPDDQLVLTLREVEGLSYAELAEALGCSVEAVKSRLRRAREALMKNVRHFLGPGVV